MEVADWLNTNTIHNTAYDSDNDSTSTYNTEDADAENIREELWFNQCLQQPKYAVNIDFDEASNAWKANKRSIGNGSYRYIRTFAREATKKAIAAAAPPSAQVAGVRTRSQTAAARK